MFLITGATGHLGSIDFLLKKCLFLKLPPLCAMREKPLT